MHFQNLERISTVVFGVVRYERKEGRKRAACCPPLSASASACSVCFQLSTRICCLSVSIYHHPIIHHALFLSSTAASALHHCRNPYTTLTPLHYLTSIPSTSLSASLVDLSRPFIRRLRSQCTVPTSQLRAADVTAACSEVAFCPLRISAATTTTSRTQSGTAISSRPHLLNTTASASYCRACSPLHYYSLAKHRQCLLQSTVDSRAL